ncbi:3-methyladenine DNA glycosylase AlkD [Chishuiella changwenlii]|uniref:3-methyladenine DNA glycosylase AlkD n=1 Tax=Chishuiella changwenlii TaxID=1434701 RepID=A0A1M6SV76_9FLAO|nr:DNA alkylation repair protein [Chishuiella changwenlii]GGF09194.1 DNA alkylation repair protein [Chishuiella changwenlii]SHK48540.1 3-methyladenine DNA glycosylase AlkD [Chishuiella changwenlii]
MILNEIKFTLQALANPEKAKILMRFFKTDKGEYGEGDTFLGITVPEQRLIAKQYFQNISLKEIEDLLSYNIHEYRLTSLLMLVFKYEKTKDIQEKKEIVLFYLSQTSRINNWDLVDTSCYKIVGHYCFHENEEQILYNLASSDDLWEKRIAIVSTMYFIRQQSLEIVTEMVLRNMNHSHDLMHKANGWMLREMGKKDESVLIDFLDEYAIKLPRTSLRYALEKLEPSVKDYYMKLK